MKLDNLQILRGISALLVCCFHFKEYLNIKTHLIGDFIFSKGSIGVPLFFIISGFIMVYTTKSSKYNSKSTKLLLDFLIKRIIRIVPLYYLLTFAWIILGGGLALYLSGDNFSRVWHSLLFLPQKDEFPVLYLGWSLNSEMFFYLLFALSFLFGKNRYYVLFGILTINIILGQLYEFQSAYLTIATSMLNIYFVIGMTFGLLFDKMAYFKKFRTPIIIISVSLFLLFLTPLLQWKNSMTIGVVSLLFFGFLNLRKEYTCKLSKILIKIGDYSYSLYLVHPFVEIIFRKFKFENWLNVPLFAMMLSTSIIAAYIFYQLIETKTTNYLKRKLL